MAFKSEAQKRHFMVKLAQGIITQEQFDKMAKGTPARIPDRVGDTKELSPRAVPKPSSQVKTAVKRTVKKSFG